MKGHPMSINTSHITDKLAALVADLDGCVTSYDESKAASLELASLDFGNADDVSRWQALASKSHVYDATTQIAALKETLAADLMEGTHKYIVSDANTLVSPAGFHPDEKVFVQTAIAIHTNSLDNLPRSNRTLYSHPMS
jgi:hypothetical protein